MKSFRRKLTNHTLCIKSIMTWCISYYRIQYKKRIQPPFVWHIEVEVPTYHNLKYITRDQPCRHHWHLPPTQGTWGGPRPLEWRSCYQIDDVCDCQCIEGSDMPAFLSVFQRSFLPRENKRQTNISWISCLQCRSRALRFSNSNVSMLRFRSLLERRQWRQLGLHRCCVAATVHWAEGFPCGHSALHLFLSLQQLLNSPVSGCTLCFGLYYFVLS